MAAKKEDSLGEILERIRRAMSRPDYVSYSSDMGQICCHAANSSYCPDGHRLMQAAHAATKGDFAANSKPRRNTWNMFQELAIIAHLLKHVPLGTVDILERVCLCCQRTCMHLSFEKTKT